VNRALSALNTITENKVIGGYAIGGAIAASYYIEAAATEDIDAFVFMVPEPGSFLIGLGPIYKALIELGGEPIKEHIKIGNWLVQILPDTTKLVGEAIANSISANLFGVPTKVFSPEYICAIALETGRFKDFNRVGMFIEQKQVDLIKLEILVNRFGLQSQYARVTTGINAPIIPINTNETLSGWSDNQLTEAKEYIVRSKASMRNYTRSLSWEEKIASIERMKEIKQNWSRK
jgi:hypothetical protein